MCSKYYTTILIGNGLGMALDPNHFRLSSGLSMAWRRLDSDTQKSIKELITNSTELTSEAQLKNITQRLKLAQY